VAHLEPALLQDLFDRARAARWAVAPARFEVVLIRSLDKAGAGESPREVQAEGHLQGLHLEDLALACGCEDGHEGAWEHFVREFRPQLYRAATAIDPTGGARDLADGLYADLFGLKERDGVRQSLFRYFHGRSSLATWLRSVLAQRHVDRLRTGRRLEPLPDESEAPAARYPPAANTAPTLDRLRHATALMAALAAALGRLSARDRLRLACYYAQNLTLAQIGRLTGEHESTVSRHLTSTRRDVRREVEQQLRQEHRMGEAEVVECFAGAVDDAGTLDLGDVLSGGGRRKDSVPDRSS
jgi:RNA polymerase sigma-70 factor (ECF subfamily)